MKKLLMSLTFFLVSNYIFAQINPAQAQAELNKRGISQSELEAKLKSKGIDINNINPANAAQVEAEITKAVAELEAEKGASRGVKTTPSTEQVKKNTELPQSELKVTEEKIKNSKTKPSTAAEVNEKANNIAIEKSSEITKAVENGATVDEAITEELLESQDKKPLSNIYGVNVFRDGSIKVFRNSEDLKASDNYVLGVGDELAVSIWGRAEYSGTLQVVKEGYIQPDRMPRIYVKGLTYKKAREMIRSKFSQYYPFSSENFAVAVSYKRTITVNILGEVFKPGSYSLPAINTAFNALVAAGGPSDLGSVRNIKLIRAGQAPKTIDVYEYLKNADAGDNLYLEDNDIISIPMAGKIVSLTGAVKRSARFELLPNEHLNKLIDFAGGLADNAYQENIQVKRFENDKEIIADLKYKSLLNSKSDYNLFSGDVVSFNTIPKSYENFVEISGAVNIPKRYELGNGMKISELINKAVLQKEARTDIAFLQRTNNDQSVSYQKISIEDALKNPSGESNLILLPKDKLIIYTQEAFVDRFQFTIDGAVRTPKSYPFDNKQTIKVEDAILMAGGLKPDATDFAYIIRENIKNNKEKEYIRINLKNALIDPKSLDNTILKPSDRLSIPSRLTYTDAYNVTIVGAVRSPGEFHYDETLTLKDLLTLAGGMKLEAASNRVEVSRVVMKNNEPTRVTIATLDIDKNLEALSGGSASYKLQPFDLVAVRSVPEFSLQKYITLEGEVRYPGSYALAAPNEPLSSVIERAGGLSREAFPEGAKLFREDGGTGAVVMDLKEALKDNNSRFNYILKPSDLITIPKAKELVTIRGAIRAADVYQEDIVAGGKINVPFHNGKRAMFYINEYAAGVTKNAKKTRITVLQPSGKINRTLNFGLFKIYPKVTKGSIVTVGTKDPKPAEVVDSEGKKKKEDIDWGKIVANGTAQATAIISLIIALKALTQ